MQFEPSDRGAAHLTRARESGTSAGWSQERGLKGFPFVRCSFIGEGQSALRRTQKTPAEGVAFDRGLLWNFSPYLMTMRRVVVLNEPERNCTV